MLATFLLGLSAIPSCNICIPRKNDIEYSVITSVKRNAEENISLLPYYIEIPVQWIGTALTTENIEYPYYEENNVLIPDSEYANRFDYFFQAPKSLILHRKIKIKSIEKQAPNIYL